MRRIQIEIFRKRFPYYPEIRWDQCLLMLGPIKIFRSVLEEGIDVPQPKPSWLFTIVIRVFLVWTVVWLLSLVLKRG